MALDQFGIEAFLTLKQRGACLDTILTLGRQQLVVHPIVAGKIPGVTNICPDFNWSSDSSGEDTFADSFFREIGAKQVDSLDASDYESCTFVHDLNQPVPSSWHANYDVVFDGGTLEHVYHFPQAITNAMNLVAEGGYYINCSPCNNYNGHSFYQFSPELYFRTFCDAQGFEVQLMALVESRQGGRKFSVRDPEEMGFRTSFQGVGPLQLVMIAQRKRVGNLTPDFHPTQSDYARTWEQDAGKKEVPPARTTLSSMKKNDTPVASGFVAVSLRWFPDQTASKTGSLPGTNSGHPS